MRGKKEAFILEAILILCAILAVVGIVVPFAIRANDNANRLECLENLRIIGEAMRQWSLEHDYALPPGRGMSGFCNSVDGQPLPGNMYAIEPGLNALWDKGNGVIKDVNVFRCPADRHLEPPPQSGEDFTSPGQLSYSMTGHLYPTDPPNKVIVADKSDRSHINGSYIGSGNHNNRFINVLFFDGTVRTVTKPILPPGTGSDPGSIYVMETGDQYDTYLE